VADPNLYVGREQTRVKHEILRRYLVRFAHIVGSRWDTISYVDGFSGPWRSQSERREDTSFSIAIEQLRHARSTIDPDGRHEPKTVRVAEARDT
jgi:three-Cys-motif partner protein